MFSFRRNFRSLTKQAIWIFIWLQLTFICFLAISFRNDSTRSMLQENVFDPILNRVNFKSDVGHVKKSRHKKVEKPAGTFQNFDVSNWGKTQKLHLVDDKKVYFKSLKSGQKCFIEGTDFAKSETSCKCLPDYYGTDCGIPDAVWYGHYSSRHKDRERLKVRDVPRRIIHGVPVNHEFDFFEARVKTLHDVVDAFIIQESNFTTFGSQKDLHFLDKFRQGWLGEFQNKFLYVFLSHFTEKGKDNGWYADAYIRVFLSRRGLPMVENKRDDDLFLLLDADELPLREVLLFLKLYDGYTEPIRFGFRWTVFGFFWLKADDPGLMEQVPILGKLFHKTKERLLQLWVVCTLGMLDQVYSNNSMLLRRNVWDNDLLKDRVDNYTGAGHVIHEWDIGTLGHYAGFHCSWCYSAEGIRTKLLSAQKHDSPRWGDFPEKTNVSYINELIRTGGWFDDTFPFIRVKASERSQKFYAPKYILDNADQFKYLLEASDAKVSKRDTK